MPARRADLPGWQAAGKTGTTEDFRDAWFIGYTSHLVTGIWLGNDDGKPTKKVTGGGLPVEIWSRIMRGAHQGVTVAALPGTAVGGLFSGWSGSGPAMPPVPVQPPAASAAPPPASDSASLDGWLINNLFSRR